MEDEIAVFIPIVTVVSIAAVVALSFYLRFRTRSEVQQTLRAAIEHGQALTPEVLERLAEPRRSRATDLRRGVTLIAVGLGLAAFGQLLGEEDAGRPFLAMGAMPVLIGVAFLGLWRLAPRE